MNMNYLLSYWKADQYLSLHIHPRDVDIKLIFHFKNQTSNSGYQNKNIKNTEQTFFIYYY